MIQCDALIIYVIIVRPSILLSWLVLFLLSSLFILFSFSYSCCCFPLEPAENKEDNNRRLEKECLIGSFSVLCMSLIFILYLSDLIALVVP